VIVINKSDLTDDPALLTDEIIPVAPGIPVILSVRSVVMGLPASNRPYSRHNDRIIGSSGVGKSTLITGLLDRPIQETSVIRNYDGKGGIQLLFGQLFIIRIGATHDR